MSVQTEGTIGSIPQWCSWY